MSRRIADVPRLHTFGRVARVVGLAIEVSGLEMGLGELARITNTNDARSVLAEVVGFHQNGCLLMPLGELDGIAPGASVVALGRSFGVDVGPGLLGRVLNGLGHPIDDKGKMDVEERAPLQAEPPNPLHRQVIDSTMPSFTCPNNNFIRLYRRAGSPQSRAAIAEPGSIHPQRLGMVQARRVRVAITKPATSAPTPPISSQIDFSEGDPVKNFENSEPNDSADEMPKAINRMPMTIRAMASGFFMDAPATPLRKFRSNEGNRPNFERVSSLPT